MLMFGVVALGVTDVQRAAEFWSAALGYTLQEGGFGGWSNVLMPPNRAGTAIALQLSQTPPQDHPRLHIACMSPMPANRRPKRRGSCR